jgi:hypothetical protein
MKTEVQRQKEAILSLMAQNAALIRERDNLQKIVWDYEKNGVTCQTYRHHLNVVGCGECNTGK